MSIGTKMQRAYARSYTRQGKQEDDLIIRQKVRGNVTVIGGDYSSYTQTDDILLKSTDGFDVQRVSAYEVSKEGKLHIDDTKFMIPGQFVTEAQLKNSVLLYNGKTYSIILKSPTEIFSGIPVQWRVYGRTEG